MVETVETNQTAFKLLAERANQWRELIKHIFENPEKFFDAVGEACETALSFYKELEENAEKKADFLEFAGITDEELQNATPAELLEQVTRYMEKHGEPVETEALQAVIVTAKKLEKYEFPLDKVNNSLFSNAELMNPETAMPLKAERDGSKTTADIIVYVTNFDELEKQYTITKPLDVFDKDCYNAIANLFVNGNEYISTTQIYHAMGNKKRPSSNDLKKISESIDKMRKLEIHLNNKSEHRIYPNYAEFVYDDFLLPIAKCKLIINGQQVEQGYRIKQTPILFEFAKSRGQVIGIKPNVLEIPISKTEANRKLIDYLLQRIGMMKNSRESKPSSRKMLYSKIYEKTGITTAKQKQRAKEKILTCLKHFKAEKFIKGFKEENDGIEIEP